MHPATLLLAATLLALSAQAQTASFELLPPSGYNNVETVSPNGDAVLLWRSSSDLREAVWHDDALTPVASPPCASTDSYRALAVSDDGVPSGYQNGADTDLWLWHGSTCRAVVGPGSVRIQGVSPDGAHAAGFYIDNSGGEGTYRGGFVFSDGAMQVFPPQGAGNEFFLTLGHISEDGSVAAGSESHSQQEPTDAVVVRDGVKATLPVPAGDRVTPVDVAGDGTVLASALSLTSGFVGHYLYTDEEVVALPMYETAFGSASVHAASRGGARVVGSVQVSADPTERVAVIWDDGVPRRLAEMLAEHGVDTSEIPAFLTPVDISNTGRVIVGTTGAGSASRVWRAVLPATARWAEAANGAWDDPDRWAPAAVPDSLTATAIVAADGGHTVTFRRAEAAASLAVAVDGPGLSAVTLALDGHTLTLGPGTTPLVVGPDASGALALDGGTLVVDGSAVLGGSGEAQGVVFVEGGHTLAVEGGLVVGGAGTDPTGSALFVNEGTVTTTAGMLVGEGPGASGVVSVSAGGSLQNTVEAASSVGSEGEGALDVAGGFVSHTGPVYLGAFETGRGRVALASGASVLTTDTLVVGLRGAGELAVASGAGLSTGPAVVGAREGSVGSVRVAGAGSRWDVVGDVVVGDRGAAVLEVVDGAFLCLGGASRVGPQGRVVTDATVRIEPLVDCAALAREGRVVASGIRAGSLTLAAGAAVEAAAVEVGPGGVVDGEGALAVPLTVEGTLAPGGDGALGALAMSAPLTLRSGATLSVDVGPAAADAVAVMGAATLGGTLRVAGLDGPPVGARYDVLTADAISGAFDRIEAPEGIAVSVSATAVTVTVTGPVDAEDGPAGELMLGAPSPNPAAGSVTLAVSVPAAGPVRLAVYDALGREVRVLASGPWPAGAHEVGFDGSGLPAGVYLVRLDAGGTVRTRAVTLAR